MTMPSIDPRDAFLFACAAIGLLLALLVARSVWLDFKQDRSNVRND